MWLLGGEEIAEVAGAMSQEAAHADGAQKLRRMLKGLHPDVKVGIWPDGHDARVPSHPVSVDWS